MRGRSRRSVIGCRVVLTVLPAMVPALGGMLTFERRFDALGGAGLAHRDRGPGGGIVLAE